MTIPIIVQASPGGANGYHCQVGEARKQRWGAFRAISWTREKLVELGASKAERVRVLNLLIERLQHKNRVEFTVEVNP